jgi:hypothetical protein
MEHTSGEYGKGNQISKLCGYIFLPAGVLFKKTFHECTFEKRPVLFFVKRNC